MVPTRDEYLPVLARFIRFGLHPGQFGELVIRRQWRQAAAMHVGPCAFYDPEADFPMPEWVKPPEQWRKDEINAVIEWCNWFTENTPEGWFRTPAQVSEWICHSGLEGATDTVKVMMNLITPRWWLAEK